MSSVLIDDFTSKPFIACPGVKHFIEKAIKSLENKGYKVSAIAHHACYKPDFLTISESDQLQ